MKFGFVMPPLNAHAMIDFGVEAERAGWDGFFLSDTMWSIDAWLCLSAIAARTNQIRLGTLLSPLSIMRPWKLAVEAATLDQISNGRAILTIGMGATDTGFAEFGEEIDLKIRSELVDEGLMIIKKLWAGQPFLHKGKHYSVDLTTHEIAAPQPIQKPRIPIWVVGAWPRPKSMQRVLHCDGIVPVVKPKNEEAQEAVPEDIQQITAWLAEQNKSLASFDIVIEGRTPGDDPSTARATIQRWENAGATWWIESWWGAEEARIRRLRQGPPDV